jgi:hypothetical protein
LVPGGDVGAVGADRDDGKAEGPIVCRVELGVEDLDDQANG